MSSNSSTEQAGSAGDSGNASAGTIGGLKSEFANLLINRVTLGECLNVIRDACVARAADIVDQADDTQLEAIKNDVAAFNEAASSSGDAGNVGTGATGPVSAVGATGPTGPITTGAIEGSAGNVGEGNV